MPITIANKPQLTGIIILFIGVALLAFTFLNAFMFLKEPLGILTTGDLANVFGEALAPLIQACIRLMYLGIMGWIGSMLTVRGIPLVTHKSIPVAAPAVVAEVKPQLQPKPQAVEQPKPAPKPATQPPQQPAPQPKPAPQQEPSPPPQPQTPPPQQTPQQPKPEPQPQPSAPQEQPPAPMPEPKQEEPKAILIPPENQREE